MNLAFAIISVLLTLVCLALGHGLGAFIWFVSFVCWTERVWNGS